MPRHLAAVPILLCLSSSVIGGRAEASECDSTDRRIVATYDGGSGTLTVTGGAGPDFIEVSVAGDGTLRLNGGPILVDGRWLTIGETAHVEIDGGAGNDILLGGTVPDLALYGGTGLDHLVWFDTEGLVVVADRDRNSTGGWYLGGTAIDGLFTIRSGDLLQTARLLDVPAGGLVVVRGTSAGGEHDDVIVDGTIVTGPFLESDDEVDLFLVNAPGGDNANTAGGPAIYLANAVGGDGGGQGVDLHLVAAATVAAAGGSDGELDLFLVNAPGGDNADVDGDGDLDLASHVGALRRARR